MVPSHMDGSIVLARWRQCAPPPIHSNWCQHCTCADIAESPSVPRPSDMSGHVLGRSFSPSKLPLHMWGSGPHLMHGSLGPPKSTSQSGSRSVEPFFAGLTDLTRHWQSAPLIHATPSVAICRILLVTRRGIIIRGENKTNQTYWCSEAWQKGRGRPVGRECLPWQAHWPEASALRWVMTWYHRQAGQVCFDSAQQTCIAD